MNPVNMCDSRYEILKILKRERSTVDDLSAKLKISPTAIRQHLTILEAESLVRKETLKEGIGRPKILYTMTEKAEDLFPKHYSWLLENLITEITREQGEEKVSSFFQTIGSTFSQPYLEKVRGKSIEERIAIVVSILNEWGAYASVESGENVRLLKNYNCSFYEIAQKFPQVCDVHTEFLKNLLDRTPQQTACMAEGKDCCTYQIRID